VPNFKLWHDPDPTNCRTRAKEPHSANSQTQKNHSVNAEEILAVTISKGRPVPETATRGPKDQSSSDSGEKRADPAHRPPGKSRSKEVPEIIDLLTSRISEKPKVNRQDRARTAKTTTATNPLEKVVPIVPVAIGIILSIRDQEVHPAFQNLRALSAMAMAIDPKATGTIAVKNDLGRVVPMTIAIVLSLPDRRACLVFQKNLEREGMPIPIVPTTVVTEATLNKDPSGKQSKNHLFNPG